MMRCAIYASKSTEQDGVNDDDKPVTRQTEHARSYAEKKDWTVADEHTYSDDGISGAEGTVTYAEGYAPLFTLPCESGVQKSA